MNDGQPDLLCSFFPPSLITSLHVGIANLFTDEETMAQGYKVTGRGRDSEPTTMEEGRHTLIKSKDSKRCLGGSVG